MRRGRKPVRQASPGLPLTAEQRERARQAKAWREDPAVQEPPSVTLEGGGRRRLPLIDDPDGER